MEHLQDKLTKELNEIWSRTLNATLFFFKIQTYFPTIHTEWYFKLLKTNEVCVTFIYLGTPIIYRIPINADFISTMKDKQ